MKSVLIFHRASENLCLEIKYLFEEAGIAVTEEAEVVGEGVVVEVAPFVADECADKEQECRFGLVKVGDYGVDDAIAVARDDDYARLGNEGVGVARVEIVQYGVQGFGSCKVVRLFVWIPLGYFAVEVAVGNHTTDMVKAFERADGSRADSGD